MLLARFSRLSPRRTPPLFRKCERRKATFVGQVLSSTAATCVGSARATMSGGTGIVWFKPTDLRLDDHEPLLLAHQAHAQVLHLFVFDDTKT